MARRKKPDASAGPPRHFPCRTASASAKRSAAEQAASAKSERQRVIVSSGTARARSASPSDRATVCRALRNAVIASARVAQSACPIISISRATGAPGGASRIETRRGISRAARSRRNGESPSALARKSDTAPSARSAPSCALLRLLPRPLAQPGERGRALRRGRQAGEMIARAPQPASAPPLGRTSSAFRPGLLSLSTSSRLVQARHRGDEAEPQPRARLGAARLQPHEALRHPCEFRRIDTRPVVGNRENDSTRSIRHRDRQPGLPPLHAGMLQRIVDEIGKRLADQLAIALQRRRCRRFQDDRRTGDFCQRLVELEHVAGDRRGVDGRELRVRRSRLDAGDHQERVERLDQLVGIVDDRPEHLPVVLARLARERRFDPVAHARQRRLQIVCDVVGDFLQPEEEPLDPRQHRVQAFRQPVELVPGPRHFQPAREVAADDPCPSSPRSSRCG